jgi:hypothetical protein
MTLFQTVVLAAGPNSFAGSAISSTKIQAPFNKGGSTLLQECLYAYRESTKTVCAVNVEDLAFAEEVAGKFGGVKIKPMRRETHGALITLAMCLEELDPNLPIVVASVDGLVPNYVAEFSQYMYQNGFDGGAITIQSNNAHLSYVLESGGTPIEFAEKRVVSNLATTGIFYFSNLDLILKSIEWVLVSKTDLEGKYYISSAINRLVFDDKKVGLFAVDSDTYFRFSTPSEYLDAKKAYERSVNGSR